MKFNLRKVLRGAVTAIGIGKEVVSAVKGKELEEQVEIGAESLIALLPAIEGVTSEELADNGKWEQAVSALRDAVLFEKRAAQRVEVAVVAVKAVIADIKAKRQ